MFHPRPSVILVAICLLAFPLCGVLLPHARAQALILTPSTEEPPVVDGASPADPILQAPEEAFAGLPLDRKGAVDWMRVLNAGIIAPRTSVKQMVMEEMQILDKDVIMKNTREMPYVKFPHKPHTQWLSCSNCHDEIFAAKAGSSQISMRKIFMGEYCGVCHGKVAFTPTNYCERCHSVPHGNTKAWW
jgi:c(7)-type cytochrome triheme protein